MLLQNAIKAPGPEGLFLKSLHGHDFASQKISDQLFFTDGGLNYIRGSVNTPPCEPWHLSTENTFDEILAKMLIDINPKDGEYTWKPLKDATKLEVSRALVKLNGVFKNGGGYVVQLTRATMIYKLDNENHIGAESYEEICGKIIKRLGLEGADKGKFMAAIQKIEGQLQMDYLDALALSAIQFHYIVKSRE